eukprot:SAG11_NODE_1038_length_6076_cov_4.857454_7_plen_59_part_00
MIGSGYYMCSSWIQTATSVPIETETEIHDFFLPRIRYGTGTTDDYRQFASTAVVPRVA